MIQCCCKSVCPQSGKRASLWYSSAVFAALAWLPMSQCFPHISFTLRDAVGRVDFRTLYACEASAGVVTFHLGLIYELIK